MYQGEYQLVGSEMSFFTRKLEAQLRYQKIPWRYTFKTEERKAELEARAGTHFVPLLITPDKWLINDTIAIGPMLIDHNCDYYHEGISQVIADQPDSPHQLAYIQDRGHVPTLDAGPVNNTVDAFMGDILADNPGAPFRKIPGLKMMLMGHSFFKPFAEEMPYHAVRAGIDGHSQQLETSGGESGAPPGPVERYRPPQQNPGRVGRRRCRTIWHDLLRHRGGPRWRKNSDHRGL